MLNISSAEISRFKRKAINSAAIKAWSDCMATKDWKVGITGDIWSSFSLSISYSGNGNLSPTFMKTNEQGAEITSIGLKESDQLKANVKREISYTRNDTSKPGMINIFFNGQVEDIAFYLPKEPVIEAAPTPTPFPSTNAVYSIVPKSTEEKGFCLAAQDSKDRSSLWQVTCNSSDQLQKFRLSTGPDNSFAYNANKEVQRYAKYHISNFSEMIPIIGK